MADALDLSALRLVRAIADAGSITSAAATLGCTQPAVSQHVRRLERRLGTALFERTARGVRLTEAGEVLARCGASVSVTVDAAEREIQALIGLQSGLLRIAAFPTASAVLVPRALTLLRGRAPQVEVHYTEAEPEESVEALRQGRHDIVLAYGEPDVQTVSGLHRLRLLSDPCVLAMAPDDPLAARKRLQLRDLAQVRWIAGRHRGRHHLTASAAQAGFTPHVVMETDDYVATFAFVAAGLGVALLPSLVAASAERLQGIELRSVAGAIRRPVFALTTPDLLRVPVVAAALETLQEASTGL